MPKDEWANGRRKDLAKKVAATDRDKARQKRAGAWEASQTAASRLQQPTTRLWFGKYNGCTLEHVKRIDPSYLGWLSQLEPSEDAWRLKLLVAYLKRST